MDRQPWRLGPRGQRWFDLGLTGALLLPVPAVAIAGMPYEAALSALQVAPLAVRRRHPALAFALVASLSALQVLVVDQPVWGQVAFPVAVYSLARFGRPVPAAVGLGVGLCAAVVASLDWLRGLGAPYEVASVGSYVLFLGAIVATSWALGTLGRTREAYVAALVERGERIEREAVQQVELAATEERARIAREMHDVVAHGLSVIVVQADGARYAAAQDPVVASRALETVAATAREALTEMRRMLGLLRAGDTGTRPQPRLDDVTVLVTEARAAGTEVEASLPEAEASAAVPDGVALTAYRVVQEALTNVRKHAGPGARTRVEVRVGAASVDVVVEDDGRGAASADDGRGLGLLGMRERVAVHDGELVAGPRPGGGFRVGARIPR